MQKNSKERREKIFAFRLKQSEFILLRKVSEQLKYRKLSDFIRTAISEKIKKVDIGGNNE